MSYFTGDNQTTGEDQTTNTDGNTQPEDYLGLVVGEKGEQWKDPSVLAKGYVHAQNRIKELEELAKKARDNDAAERLLEELRKKATDPVVSQTPNQNPNGTEEGNTTQSSADLERLVEETISKREQANTAKENLTQADRMLSEAFGTEASKTVEAKAKELGLSKEELTSLASKSPSAFMTLIGQPPKKDTNTSLTSTVNTSGFQASGERDSKYYSDLRRKNKKLYYSPETQAQMFNDRKRLGDKF